jgi:hypothetical protein
MANFDVTNFEQCAHQEENTYWYAHDFMELLGYETWNSFKGVINKSIASCANLEIDIQENFIPCEMLYEEKIVKSYKLTRFACFLVTMHADSKKEEVSKAKTVFAAVADKLIQNQIDSNEIQRLEVRKKLADSESMMSAVAVNAGLESKQLGIFKDAGFRGMYNMSLQDLKAFKRIPNDKKTLYDFMGNTELAGNWFRVTQTAEKIKNHNVQGLHNLTRTAREVGSDVRQMMIQNSGIAPENLELEKDIKDVKKALKGANKQMIKHDKQKK